MPLFSVVRLKESGRKFAVQSMWIEGMKSAATIRYGCRPTKQRTIFFSPNANDAPNFELTVRADFNATKNGCYKGYVLKTFGKIWKCYLSSHLKHFMKNIKNNLI